MSKNFYITTTLPYVNADPHVGFATELIRADAIARVKKLQGFNVFFNTGTDEHGQKIQDASKRDGVETQAYVDSYAEKFRELGKILNISEDAHFIRTTDEKHVKAAQEFWKRCDANGFIYKKIYKTKYCVGCELEKTDSELVDGKCPIHPNMDIQLIEEENYFFKFSEFQQKLLDLYASRPDFVVPDFRFNEIKSFVSSGLQDFSISRLKSKMSWGVPVPGDDDHVMYVWFDALVSYISTLGWPYGGKAADGENDADGSEAGINLFNDFWRDGFTVQYCGKDNLRQQSAMWQAMLMAAGLPNTKQIIIDGFLTGEGGMKMSKSLGNTVNPLEVVEQYSADALRFFCLSELSSFEDSPFTMERFKESYNAKLANGIGNLTSRIMKMAETNLEERVSIDENTLTDEYFSLYDSYDFAKVCQYIWSKISELDAMIQDKKPFALIKINKEDGVAVITELVQKLYTIARMLTPLMPETSSAIKICIKANKVPSQPLFIRHE